MSKKTKLMRVDEDFYNWSKVMSASISEIHQRQIPTTEFTKNLSSFIQEEGVDNIIKRRAKRGQKRGWF